ncbi:MAG TPA: hypothetical protein VK929_09595 [Longimicrobiales bacterium]|nr:hypothetical protein [Longimicrobiales bacterium]
MDFGLLLIIVFILAPLLERLLGLGRGQQQPPQQGPRPGQRRPGQPGTPQPQRRAPAPIDDEEVPFRSVPAGHDSTSDDAAAGMLPDDLWEILTGEKRPTTRGGKEPVDAAPPPPVTPVPAPRGPDAAQRRDQKFRLEQQRDAERRAEAQRAAERERERIRNRPAGAPRERRPQPAEMRTPVPPQASRQRRPAGPPPSDADRLVRKVPVRAARVAISQDEIILGAEERHDRFHERIDREAAEAAEAAAAAAAPQVELFEDRQALRRAIIVSEVLGRPRGLD